MAFAGVLSDADITKALDECKGEFMPLDLFISLRNSLIKKGNNWRRSLRRGHFRLQEVLQDVRFGRQIRWWGQEGLRHHRSGQERLHWGGWAEVSCRLGMHELKKREKESKKCNLMRICPEYGKPQESIIANTLFSFEKWVWQAWKVNNHQHNFVICMLEKKNHSLHNAGASHLKLNRTHNIFYFIWNIIKTKIFLI